MDSFKEKIKAFKDSITGVEKSVEDLKKLGGKFNGGFSSQKKEGIGQKFSNFFKGLLGSKDDSFANQKKPNYFKDDIQKIKQSSKDDSFAKQTTNYFKEDIQKIKPKAISKDDFNPMKSFMGKSNTMDADLTMPKSVQQPKPKKQNMIIDLPQIEDLLETNQKFKTTISDIQKQIKAMNDKRQQFKKTSQKRSQSINNKQSNSKKGHGIY